MSERAGTRGRCCRAPCLRTKVVHVDVITYAYYRDYDDRTRSRANAPPTYRWTIDAYHRAIDACLFQGRRVELVNGELFEIPRATVGETRRCYPLV